MESLLLSALSKDNDLQRMVPTPRSSSELAEVIKLLVFVELITMAGIQINCLSGIQTI
jgi:hypothetical protein